MSIAAQLGELFSMTLNVDVPSAETDLVASGVLDSLALIEVLLYLEREFGMTVSLDDLDLENFRSIARIAAFVERRRAQGGQQAAGTDG